MTSDGAPLQAETAVQPAPEPLPEALEALGRRLRQISHNLTYRRIGYAAGIHPQTARRYLNGDRPSVEFLIAFCGAFDVSADWLLVGRGPERWSQRHSWAARTCSAGDLCRALADAMDAAEARIAALEALARGEVSAPEPPPLPSTFEPA